MDLEVVWFQDRHGIGLGAVKGGGEKNAVLVDERGEVQRLKRSRTLHTLRARLSGSGGDEAPAVRDRLRRLRADLEAGAPPLDPALLDLVLEDEARYGLGEVARLALGEASDGAVTALVTAMSGPEGLASCGLRLDQGQVVRLDAATRGKIKEQREREARREREEAAFLAWWTARRDVPGGFAPSPGEPDADPDVAARLANLVAWALSADLAPGAAAAQRLSRSLGAAEPDDLLVLLERGGAVPRHVNEHAHRAGLARGFSADARAEAEALLHAPGDAPPPGAAVLDLRDRHALAIDDPDTREVDDALSAWVEDGVTTVAVHIARVAGAFPPGGPLDREVMRRATTVYFSDENLPMLPPGLGEDLLSLGLDRERLAVSLLLRVGDDGLPQGARFAATRVRVHERLAYEAAPTGPSAQVLERLAPLARRLREARARDGAVQLTLPQLRLKARDGVPEARVVPTDGPLNLVVSELMVLYNVELGRALAAGGAAALFRTQPRPVRAPTLAPGDPLFAPLARRGFPPTIVATEPGPHRLLGVPVYVQGTSPLRRAGDLLAQRQLLALLGGGPPVYDRPEVERLRQGIEAAEKRVQRAVDERERYWVCEWLRARGAAPLEGVVSRVDERLVLVYLPVLDREQRLALPAAPVAVGDRVTVRVARCDPRRRDVLLEVVSG